MMYVMLFLLHSLYHSKKNMYRSLVSDNVLVYVVIVLRIYTNHLCLCYQSFDKCNSYTTVLPYIERTNNYTKALLILHDAYLSMKS